MNKTALITGASSGIGLEFAKLLAKENYNLVIISQNESNLEAAKMLLLRANANLKIWSITKDLSFPHSAEEIYDFTVKNAIKIDVLINNAGIQVYGPFHTVDLDATLRLIHINLIALTKLTRLFMKDMVKRGTGKILNVGSTGSFQPVPLNAAYCASKAFVLYLSEGIAEELKGTGVTITTLCPGATKSQFAIKSNIENIKLFSGRLLAPSVVASAGYKALLKGKRIVVVGLLNMITVALIRFLPSPLVTKLGMKLMQKA